MRMLYDKRVANAVSSIVPIDTSKMSVYLFDCHGNTAVCYVPLIRAVCTAVFGLHTYDRLRSIYQICDETKREKKFYENFRSKKFV